MRFTESPAASGLTVDAARIERALEHEIEGEVRFDAASRALYATDGSNYRQPPIGVVVPRTVQDVVTTVAICRHYDAPVLPRGGGTSLAGQCCNVAVVLDFSKYIHAIRALDIPGRRAIVEPGLVLDVLRNEAEKSHLTFAPDPSTHTHCTLGGMIGNNSCGVHSMMGGKTIDNVRALEILTYEGLRLRVGATSEDELSEIIRAGGRVGELYKRLKQLRDQFGDLIRRRFPKIPRRVSGYNIDQLLPENGFHVARALVGSEGTCATVLEAEVRLVPSPPARVLVVLGYPDIFAAADHVPDVLESGPIGLEGIDDVLVEDMRKKGLHTGDLRFLPPGRGWLLVEFGGDDHDAAATRARSLMRTVDQSPIRPSSKLYDDANEEKLVWQIRESGLGATARVPGAQDTWEGWEDAAVPPEKLGRYLREFRDLLSQFEYRGALYGHFGQGCVHTRIDFDLLTRAGIDRYRHFTHRAADLVVALGGSLSGEHGDGQSRAELLPKMFGPELMQAFREFKAIWDPQSRMNPGKKVDAYRNDENLRLGAAYRPWIPETTFSFAGDDGGSFARATQRCVGVGNCRRQSGGTMCPSFMATGEEMHSTRGRARLLFELLGGDVLPRRWHEASVREALDLCLACKGCKGECPVNVDMATYKAEFLSHYYARRLRPRSAYAFGLIGRWAPIAARVPRLANSMFSSPGFARIAKWIAGVAPARSVPRFATKTLTTWFRGREDLPPDDGRRPPIVLWPDTFNNYFHPEVGQAAVRVLRRAGFRVVLPRRRLCCGRPLYDYGMLRLARRWLDGILRELGPEIAAGTPVVGLEPSCVAVFRDELPNLFPRDPQAHRLSRQCYLLSEILDRSGYQPPRLARAAVVHGHCHHKAVLGFQAEERLLRRMGLDYRVLDSGCCGMAGSFGFERKHYDMSMRIGERVLLPAVRHAPPDTLIIADGFSCREQIAQSTGRQALHLAEVLDLAALGGASEKEEAA